MEPGIRGASLGRRVWTRRWSFTLTLAVLAWTLIRLAHADNVQYSYDGLGRVVEASNATTGVATQYAYDRSGNITAIKTIAVGQLSIAGLSTSQAAPGSTITIYGTGFSTTAANDVVTFNGVSATVVSATATQLVVIVPAGASNGVIAVSVTSGGTTATTTSAPKIVMIDYDIPFPVALKTTGVGNTRFTITASTNAAPTVASFAPSAALVGTTVTITGTNFSSTLSDDKVLFNGVAANVTAATSTALTVIVPTNSGSGPVQVITPYGSATSTADFLVIPSGYTGVTSTRTTENAARSIAVAANTVGEVLFNGTQGDAGVRVITQGAVGVSVLDPHGHVIASGCTVSPCVYELATLSLTGTYSVLIPAGGTFTVTIALAKHSSFYLYWDNEGQCSGLGCNQISATVAGQKTIAPISLLAGSLIQIIPHSVGGSWTATLLSTSGTALWSSSFNNTTTSLSLPAIPSTGTYTLIFDPGPSTGTFNYSAGVVASGPLVGNGTVLTVTGGPPDANNIAPIAKINFSGTAGQYYTLMLGTTQNFYFGVNFYYLNSSGNQVCLGVNACGTGGSGGSGAYILGPLPNTGNYYFFVQLPSSVLNLSLRSSIALTANGGAASTSFMTSVPFVQPYNFSAGGSVSIAVSPATSACLHAGELLNSSGAIVSATTIASGGVFNYGTLATGSYTFVLTNWFGESFQGNPGTPSSIVASIGDTDAGWGTTTQACAVTLTAH